MNAAAPWLTHGEWVMSILTAIYVSLTGFYVYISHKTLGEIERQAEHAEAEAVARDKQFAEQLKVSRDAANAALLNAEAMIGAERAWILVAVDVTGDSPRKAHIYLRGKNWGRTPAEVSRSSVFYFPHVWDGELPDEPPYHKTELKYPKHIVPDESFAVGDGPFLLGTEMTDEMWDTMNKKNERLFFVGHIVYKDLISRIDHETRFCFFLSSQPGIGLVMTGPRHYNLHT